MSTSKKKDLLPSVKQLKLENCLLPKIHYLSDFRNFMAVLWKHLSLPEPTPVQYDIAYYMMSGGERIIIEAFRGVGKSYIAVAFVVWNLLLDNNMKNMVVSASKTRADDFSNFAHKIIGDFPLVSHLRAREDQNWSKISFDVNGAKPSGSPSVKSVGINGQLTGSRANIIMADDVETPTNSMTQPMREKLSESVKEFDAVLVPGGRVIYLGTPQTEMSLYNKLIERGYKMRVWPALYPTSQEVEKKYGDRLAPMIRKAVIANPSLVGRPTDPKRFDDNDLAKRKLSYGMTGFTLQFQLDTSMSDALKHPLSCSDLIVLGCDRETAPERVIYGIMNPLPDLINVGLGGDKWYCAAETIGRGEYTGAMLTIDPSGRGKDETSFNVTKTLNGFIYLLKSGGIRGSGYSPESLQYLADIAKEYCVNKVLVESNFGDGMFSTLLSPVLNKTYPCSMEEVRNQTMKEKRIIDTLEPLMNQHRLIVDPSVIQEDYESVQDLPEEKRLQYMLFYQLTRLTNEKGSLGHDDRIDVLAIACKHWQDQMAQDSEECVVNKREEQQIEQLEKYVTHCEGRNVKNVILHDRNADYGGLLFPEDDVWNTSNPWGERW